MKYKNYNIVTTSSGKYIVEDDAGFLFEEFKSLKEAKERINEIWADVKMGNFLSGKKDNSFGGVF